MFSRTLSRFTTLTATALLAVVATTQPAFAFDQDPGDEKKIEGAERRAKVQRVISLLKEAVGSDTDTLDSEFGTGGDNAEHSTTGGNATTINQAIQQLRNMLDTDRLRESGMSSRGAACTSQDGVSKDRVWVNSTTLDQMCDKPGAGGVDVTSDACQAAAYFLLGATLYNELTHVYQTTDSTASRCDAERDSDCASIKFLTAIYNCLTKPDPGDPTKQIPHTSKSDVLSDPQYVSLVYTTLCDANIDSAAEIAALVAKIKARLDSYTDRKENLFNAAITLGINWGPIYYNGWDGTRVTRDELTPAGTTIFPSNESLPPQNYQTIPAGQAAQSRVFENGDHQVTLVQASVDPIGNVITQYWTDTTGDGLPEQPEAIPPQPLPMPPAFGAAPDSFGIYLRFPHGMHPDGFGPGLLFHNQFDGTLVGQALGADGLPFGPPQMLIQDPAIDEFGFRYLAGTMTMPGGDVRIVFSTDPETAQLGGSPAVWFDYPAGSFVPVPSTAPGQTLAEAAGGFFPVGIAQLEQGLPDVVLGGNPGQPVDFFSIGQGFPIPLASGIAGPDGSTGPIPLPAPLEGPELFVVVDSMTHVAFLPREGTNTDCAFVDSNADTFIDRWDISVDPPRLHFSEGVSPDPLDPIKGFRYEALLPNPTIEYFQDWTDAPVQRVLASTDENFVAIEMVELNLVSSEPIIVQNNQWLLGMGLAGENDGVTIIRAAGTNEWQPIFVQDFEVAPVFVFPIPFDALATNPTHFEVFDVDADTDLDVVIYEVGTSITFNGYDGYDRLLCYINDGSGNFTQEFHTPCEGDANGDGVVDVNDISFVLFRLGNPGPDGDANGDGVVDVNDISFVLFRLGNTC